MHLCHISQYTIKTRNVHIPILNAALCYMTHFVICELGQLSNGWDIGC